MIPLDCLTDVIYHEARGTTTENQKMVGFVVMNRAEWKINKVCQTIYYPNQFHTGKNFKEPNAYNVAREISWKLLNKKYEDVSQGAVYFHNTKVRPSWSYKKTYLFTLEGHKYYK